MRHEAIVELIRLCPAFAAEMLTGVADLVVPEYESAELGSPDLSEVVPTERRADAAEQRATQALIKLDTLRSLEQNLYRRRSKDKY